MTRNQSTHRWLTEFAARLLEHFPEMNPLSAVKRAIAIYPEFDHLDAITAADQFAANPHAAREIVMRAQQQAFSGRAVAPL